MNKAKTKMKTHLSDSESEGEQDYHERSQDHDEQEPLIKGQDQSQGQGQLRQRQGAGAKFSVPHLSTNRGQGDTDTGGTFRPVLQDQRSNPEFVPEQFRRQLSSSNPSLPWKSILLGVFLLLCGVVCLLVLASDVYRGYDNEQQEERDFKDKWKHMDDESILKVLLYIKVPIPYFANVVLFCIFVACIHPSLRALLATVVSGLGLLHPRLLRRLTRSLGRRRRRWILVRRHSVMRAHLL